MSSIVTRSLAALAALVLSGSLAAAADLPRTRTVRLAQPTLVQGRNVAPGTYTLRWSQDEGSDAVSIELVQKGKIVATATGRWTMRDATSPYEALIERPAGNGARQLIEVLFESTRRAITLDGTTLAEAR